VSGGKRRVVQLLITNRGGARPNCEKKEKGGGRGALKPGNGREKPDQKVGPLEPKFSKTWGGKNRRKSDGVGRDGWLAEMR